MFVAMNYFFSIDASILKELAMQSMCQKRQSLPSFEFTPQIAWFNVDESSPSFVPGLYPFGLTCLKTRLEDPSRFAACGKMGGLLTLTSLPHLPPLLL
ncbi:hypothetical protein VN12_13095 [Pirellula sp. SH-Sr6A]|nr:hypothetical protein VN12_13095 [Pirellula sp. SH-Sr6A]